MLNNKHQMERNNKHDFPVATKLLQVAGDNSAGFLTSHVGLVRTDTNQLLSVVSPRYEILPHAEIVDKAREFLSLFSFPYEEKIYLAKNGAYLTYEATFMNRAMALSVGDEVGMRVIVSNSYVPKQAASLSIGGIVLSCLNGMVSYRCKHTVRNSHTKGIRERLTMPSPEEVMTGFDMAVFHWNELNSMQLQKKELPMVLSLMNASGFIDNKTKQDLLAIADGSDSSKSLTTAWDLMQATTYHITHEKKKMSETSKTDLLEKADRWFDQTFRRESWYTWG